MKIVMTSYYTGPKGKPELRPGDVFEIDDEEGARIISVGGARAQTADEIAADKPIAKDKPADGGKAADPT